MLNYTKAVTVAGAGLMFVVLGPAASSLAATRSPEATHLSASSSVDVTFVPWLARDLAITTPATAGDPVELKPDTGAPGQVWTITTPGNPSDKTTIINKQTGLCLSADQHAAGANVIAATCDGSLGQQWVESKETNGSWRLTSFGLTSPILQASAGVGTDLVRLASTESADQLLLDWVQH
jgi:Ricin-type beta-trefoil lectin domain-like